MRSDFTALNHIGFSLALEKAGREPAAFKIPWLLSRATQSAT